MKLPFSLATLLVCVTVLAVVCAFAVTSPVYEKANGRMLPPGFESGGTTMDNFVEISFWRRPPNNAEIARRFVLWGTPAIAVTLALLWAIRRLKLRRHTEPPGG